MLFLINEVIQLWKKLLCQASGLHLNLMSAIALETQSLSLHVSNSDPEEVLLAKYSPAVCIMLCWRFDLLPS
jgi:hypothetical protein